jgi:hypothetical protein
VPASNHFMVGSSSHLRVCFPLQVGDDMRPEGTAEGPGMIVFPPGETGEEDFFLSAKGSYRRARAAALQRHTHLQAMRLQRVPPQHLWWA